MKPSDPSSFYQALAPFYRHLFPVSRTQVAFLRRLLEPRADRGGLSPDERLSPSSPNVPGSSRAPSVLDVACGVGELALALSAEGFAVTAVDSEESMVARGRKRAAELGRNVSFVVADMLRLREAVAGPFDLVACLGNSLAHLASRGEVSSFMEQGSELLAPEGGTLVLQTVNFDRYLESGGMEFKELRAQIGPGREAVLRRSYRPWQEASEIRSPGIDGPRGVVGGESDDSPAGSGTRVSFRTELLVGADRFHFELPLLVPARSELTSLLSAAGYTDVEWFGGYDAIPWSADAPATVVTARARTSRFVTNAG